VRDCLDLVALCEARGRPIQANIRATMAWAFEEQEDDG